jgi:uracil-DNA glycosylase
MRSIEELIAAVEREARRAAFPVDATVYEGVKKDPLRPILYAGSLDAPVCVVGRDLGRDEVAAGQPLIGAGGRLVRSGIYKAQNGKEPPNTDRTLMAVLDHVLLTNTVPYKPPGNKAYASSVKERFRPFLAELLVDHWQGGDRVITLGTEAFQWFAPYSLDPAAFEAFWKRDDRYESSIPCTVVAGNDQSKSPRSRTLTVMPLPHPSPLNQRWYRLFPDLLDRRLNASKSA